MYAIQKAIDDIKFRIPLRILEKVFLLPTNTYSWRQAVYQSVDELILKNVIEARVLVDCNLLGGEQDTIDLSGLPIDQPDLYSHVIRVPKSRTQNRSILVPLNISFFTHALQSPLNGIGTNAALGLLSPQEDSMLMTLAVGLVNSYDRIPITSTSRVKLIGENVIQIKGLSTISPWSYLRCVMENDKYMANLSVRAYPAFSHLCTLACKAFIYNTLIIEMGSSELQGGQELGVFRPKVESYESAEEEYETYKTEVWSKVAFINDEEAYSRFLKLGIPAHQ